VDTFIFWAVAIIIALLSIAGFLAVLFVFIGGIIYSDAEDKNPPRE
jgi:predicted membrane protein